MRAALAKTMAEAARYADLARDLDPHLLADPYWPELADHLALAGFDRFGRPLWLHPAAARAWTAAFEQALTQVTTELVGWTLITGQQDSQTLPRAL